jgi:FkbM family methyltransferase
MIEIGANEGYHTVFAARLVSTTGRIIAYEPIPSLAERIRTNVMINEQSERVKVRDIAMSDRIGDGTFLAPQAEEWNTAVGGLIEDYYSPESAEPIAVTMSTLDADELRHTCSFLKISVPKGSERILRGGRRLLNEQRPTVYFTACEGEYRDAIKLLQALDYEVWRIGVSNRAPYYRKLPLHSSPSLGINCLAIPNS